MTWDSGRIGTKTWFLDRRADRERITNAIQARRNLLVYGPRRLGKTTLLRRVADDLQEPTFLFIDCLFVSDEGELSSAMLRALRGTGIAKGRRFLAWCKEAARGLEVAIEIRDDAVVPILRRGQAAPRPLEDTLVFLTRIAESAARGVVLVLDEFQTVMQADQKTVAKLRSHAQEQSHVSYVIAGSQPGVLLALTRHQNPFWRQLVEIHIGPIAVEEALAGVEKITHVRVPPDARERIEETVGGNTQRLVEILEAAWVQFGRFERSAIDEAIAMLLDRHRNAFERLIGESTPYQRRVLIALARDRPEHLVGTAFIEANQLKSASHVQRALGSHKNNEILDETGRFLDPLFETWIRMHDHQEP